MYMYATHGEKGATKVAALPRKQITRRNVIDGNYTSVTVVERVIS